MSEPSSLAPLVAALQALAELLRAAGGRGVVIGGVAASILGRPRLTHDVDAMLLLPDADWEQFIGLARAAGFDPRLPDVLAFARRSRVFLLRHRASGIDADISIGELPFEEETVARASVARVAGIDLPLPTPEDLIIMKAVAHRARDLGDIESLVDVHPTLDRRRIRRWVKAFAKALDAPEIHADLERILTQARRRATSRTTRRK